MKIEAIIYSKPNCMKCKMTKSLLKVFISSQSCDIIKNEKALQEAKDLGLKALPIVKIVARNTGKVLDIWNDFQPDKIKYWNVKANAVK